VGAGPLVTWGMPAVGTADRYDVLLIELAVATGGGTQQMRQIAFSTTQTQLQIADWLLQPGMTYVVKITARSTAGYSESAPNVTRVPFGSADFVSAEFTP
jgi:hypothetical protein